MQKKVLIFGLGFQGSKYVSYFLDKGYEVFGVSQTGITDILPGPQVSNYEDTKNNEIAYFNEFEYIILAINPISQQSEVLQKLQNTSAKILLEKPFTHDENILQSTLEFDNIFYCIDELYLRESFEKVLSDSITIVAPDADVYEHAIGTLLGSSKYNSVDIRGEGNHGNDDGRGLNYKIISGKYIWECRGGIIYINERRLGELSFQKSLDYICSMSILESRLIKNNFYHFRTTLEPKL